MRVILVAGYFWPAEKAGGPVRSNSNLVELLSADHQVSVVCLDRDIGDSEPFANLNELGTFGGADVHYVPHNLTETVRRLFRLHVTECDVVILSSIWSVGTSFLPALALGLPTGHRKPLVILMPRGGLEAGALAISPIKKKLSGWLFRAVYRRAVDVVAATSLSELTNSKKWFPGAKVIQVSDFPDSLESHYTPDSSDEFRVLFLGRIHPTKGLLELIQALALNEERLSLVVAGPNQDAAYEKECKRAAAKLPPNIKISWEGSVDRARVEELFNSSELLVTLTLGENFGHTIAEALQTGCPVLATDTTPWTDALLSGGGYVCSKRSDLTAVSELISRAHEDWRRDPQGVRRNAGDVFERWRQHTDFDVVSAALRATSRTAIDT